MLLSMGITPIPAWNFDKKAESVSDVKSELPEPYWQLLGRDHSPLLVLPLARLSCWDQLASSWAVLLLQLLLGYPSELGQCFSTT